MQKRIRNILKEFEQCMRNVFKEDFCKILVYGSYARGDYNENSDVDVMILVNTPLEILIMIRFQTVLLIL